MVLPAVAPALAILAGVVAGAFCPSGPGRGVLPAIWLGSALAGVCLAHRSSRLFVTGTLATFALCGWTLAAASAHRAAAPPLRAVLAEHIDEAAVPSGAATPVWVTGWLVDDVLPGPVGLQLTLDVDSIRTGSRPVQTSGRVLLSVAGSGTPGATTPWRQGRRLRMPVLLRRPTRYRDPGVADGEVSLARRGVVLVGSVKSPMLVEVVGPAQWPGETALRLREAARRTLDEHVGRRDSRSAAIARAVLIGDRAGLDRDTTERLQQAGTYHVIAISGGNIAILTALLMWICRAGRVPSPPADIVVALVLTAYAWFVGGGASVVRATLMAVTYLAARACDHRSPPSNAVAVAAALVLAADPMSVFDPGSWLTFGATIGILHGVGRVLPSLGLHRWWSRAAAGLFLASLSAELVLFPVSAFAFSRVTAAGLIVNFAAVPLMSLVQICGMATILAELVGGGLADATGLATHLAAWGLVESARVVDVVPWLTWRLPAPEWPALVAYYGGLVVAVACGLAPAAASDSLRARDTAVRRIAGRAACGVAAASAVWMLSAPHGGGVAAGRLRVTWVDVGQGDAVIVELPGGRRLLVDCGGAGGSQFDIGRRVIEPVAWARGIGRFDLLAVTHTDADHVNGAPAVTRDFRPAEVWEGVAVEGDAQRADLVRAAADVGAIWRTVQRGDRVMAGGARITVWHPPPADWERRRVRNDDSIVVEIRFGDVSIVLPGDIEVEAEAALAGLIGPAPLRVVQAAHHGSATSTTEAWLDAVAPHAVVISAGHGNRYGHPHAAVLARIEKRRRPVFRTDRDGAVTLETDGSVVEVTTFSGRRWRAGPEAVPLRQHAR